MDIHTTSSLFLIYYIIYIIYYNINININIIIYIIYILIFPPSLASELALLLLGRQELGQEAVRMMMAEA